jgi:hypothetical protein
LKVTHVSYGEHHVKKGRHRRFEEARALKRLNEVDVEPCPECGAGPDDEHASWCRATEDEDEYGAYSEYEEQEAGRQGPHG